KSPMPGGLIRGNWIYANAAFGIQFYPDCDGVDFSYNVLDDNGMLGYNSSQLSAINGRGLTISGEGSLHSDNVNVHNNVLSTFGHAGFSLISCYLPGANDWVRDSLLYQAYGTDDTCGSAVSRSGLLHGQDPRYVNRPGRDYRLQASSPARAL